MATAYVLIRELPHYRRDAFVSGLEACGYRVLCEQPKRPQPGDVVAIWNRYGRYAEAARRVDLAGGRVIVAENGYLGKDAQGIQHYALALDGHNGSGRWYVGGRERWDALGIEMKPWRQDGRHIVVRAQRGIGTPDMASPPKWHLKMAARLRAMTKRPVVVREHPANAPDQPPLEEHLRNAWALVTWASSDAGKALVAGIPVFRCAPHIVCEKACRYGIDDLENPLMGERLPAMIDLAWGQWSLAEMASGLAFRTLLERA